LAEPSPHLNVLISSKQKEFAAERQDIRELMKPLPLLIADAGEDWVPSASPIRQTFLQQARECAIYVGFFGCIYSPSTIEEYTTAAENPYREILIFVKECPQRDPELARFIDQLVDPESGRTVVVYREWGSVRPRFEKSLWSAVGRMIEHLLRLGAPPVALGDGGALERRWKAIQQNLWGLGLPQDRAAALGLARLLERQYESHG
jgi:hypothetical protein